MREIIKQLLKEVQHDEVTLPFDRGVSLAAYLEAWSTLLSFGYYVNRIEANGGTIGAMIYTFTPAFGERSNALEMAGLSSVNGGIVGKVWNASLWLNNDLKDNEILVGFSKIHDKGAKR